MLRLRQIFSRSHYYLALVRGGFSVISNEGPSVFWHKLLKLLRKRQNLARLYQQWIVLNEPSVETLNKQKQEATHFSYHPKFTLLMTSQNQEVRWVQASLDSALQQTYDNWELLAIYHNSDERTVKQVLQEYSKKDSRIKVKLIAANKDVSHDLSEAFVSSSGDFIGFLHSGDELVPFALYENVKALNTGEVLDFMYSDEDIIDEQGRRTSPFFKPDWSPDMFLSCHYMGGLCLYRKKLVDDVGGFRAGYKDSEEYDLGLRMMEKVRGIHHIPQVLYHRRMASFKNVPGDCFGMGKDPRKDNEKEDPAKKALAGYLERNKIKGEVQDGLWAGSYRVKREIQGNPLVSIIIPTKNHPKILKCCLDSILEKTDYSNYEIIIVDNQSTKTEELQNYYREIGKQSNIRILEYNYPFNFPAINNYAVSCAKGEHILFLNSDVEVISPEWLSAMLEQAQRKEVGAVGAKLLFQDGAIQHCGVIIGLGSVDGHAYHRSPDRPGYFGRVDIINNYSAVTAACMMVRKEVFLEVKGFDENLAVDYNDVDFCLRLRKKGYLIVYTPYARLYHLESYIRGYAETPEKRLRRAKEIEYFNARWGPMIEKGDPYYNPNLSLINSDFRIEPNPRRKP